MQTSPTGNVESIFARSWQLLSSNWIIIVPGIVIGLAAGIITGMLYHPATITYDANGVPNVSGAMASAAGGVIAMIVSMVATILSITYTTGMAGAAWARGTTTIADGSLAFSRDAGAVFVALIGMVVLGVIAAFLSVFTLGLAMLAYLVFFLYTMPSAIVGERPGIVALQESCAIAMKRLAPTVITVILIAVISIVVGMISGVLHLTPVLGPIFSGVITQICVAYFTLVIVGNYLAFRGDITPPTAPSGPPPAL